MDQEEVKDGRKQTSLWRVVSSDQGYCPRTCVLLPLAYRLHENGQGPCGS